MLKKKLMLFAFLGAFVIAISGCRETKAEKMEDDIENAAEEVEEEVEEVADEIEEEVEDDGSN